MMKSKTLKRLVYRAALRLFKVRIGGIHALEFASRGITSAAAPSGDFRFLTADEICAAARDPANDLDAGLATRLASGRDFCFGALDHGRLANYSWYSLGAVDPEHSLGAGFVLPADAIYMYKAFTRPEYRGRRLHEASIHRAAAHFAQQGIRRLIAIIEYGEWASLKSHTRMGCRRIGWFAMIGRQVVLWRCEPRQGVRPGCAA